MSIASSGLAKLFVGELIETALDVLRERTALEGQWLQETSGTETTESVQSSSSRYDPYHLTFLCSNYHSSNILRSITSSNSPSHLFVLSRIWRRCSRGLGQRLQVQHIQEAFRRMRCEGTHNHFHYLPSGPYTILYTLSIWSILYIHSDLHRQGDWQVQRIISIVSLDQEPFVSECKSNHWYILTPWHTYHNTLRLRFTIITYSIHTRPYPSTYSRPLTNMTLSGMQWSWFRIVAISFAATTVFRSVRSSTRHYLYWPRGRRRGRRRGRKRTRGWNGWRIGREMTMRKGGMCREIDVIWWYNWW